MLVDHDFGGPPLRRQSRSPRHAARSRRSSSGRSRYGMPSKMTPISRRAAMPNRASEPPSRRSLLLADRMGEEVTADLE